MVGTINTERTSRKSEKELIITPIDPWLSPFREFKDSELTVTELWGMGNTVRPHVSRGGKGSGSDKKSERSVDIHWRDPQLQPLPISLRAHFHHWMKAETLANDIWGGEITVYEDTEPTGMPLKSVQISFADVLDRSLFARQIMAACFILERLEGFVTEHQWDGFVCNVGTEGWRPKYHIYSPGMKPGGGPQHKPVPSKNGCYLVRLFYLGAWRCVWVDDLVPVDEFDEPLLPFSPIFDSIKYNRSKLKQLSINTESPSCTVQIWPLLLCKAIFKLAAPDMNTDLDTALKDGDIPAEFDILHALTGCVNITLDNVFDYGNSLQLFWDIIKTEVPMFSWDDDTDTLSSVSKTKSAKKPPPKETKASAKNASPKLYRRDSAVCATIVDTKDVPCYMLPALAPAHESYFLLQMARDLPLKKPAQEPDIPLWKTYRWLDWVKSHGLYEDYECPRTKYLKILCLMKLSHAPHLHDVPSADSLSHELRYSKPNQKPKTEAKKKEGKKVKTEDSPIETNTSPKRENREWILYDYINKYVRKYHVMSFPSQFELATATSSTSTRVYRGAPPKNIDIYAPKNNPLYFQINAPAESILKIALSTINPRVLVNSKVHLPDHIKPSYYILEEFEWFKNKTTPNLKCYLRTRCYDAVELKFSPGRHYFRLWISSEMHWHIMMISKSSMLLGHRDAILVNAAEECPWVELYLNKVGTAFSSWINFSKINNISFQNADRDFYRSYKPDLPWYDDVAGYDVSFIHWMFRKALESILRKRLSETDYHNVCKSLRHHLKDPDFGMPQKPKLQKSLKEVFASEPCDCILTVPEEEERVEEEMTELLEMSDEPSKTIVTESMMQDLLSTPKDPFDSNICKLATEDLECAVLKNARQKIIMKHVAATLIQATYRGYIARKYIKCNQPITTENIKILMENAFGHIEVLSLLMNELFIMFPGIKHAYSLSSGLNGGYKLDQYSGSVPQSAASDWVPFFRKTFYCHIPVSIHCHLNSNVSDSTLEIYDNGKLLTKLYNRHFSLDLVPNEYGYDVDGYAVYKEPPKDYTDATWNLTILCSTSNAFHPCDNHEPCKVLPIMSSTMFRTQEIYVPNRKNILASLSIDVIEAQAVGFRAYVNEPKLELIAVLKAVTENGLEIPLGECHGVGVICWPFVKLEANTAYRQASTFFDMKTKKVPSPEHKNAPNSMPKKYKIEVTAPKGWPITLEQWMKALATLNSVNLSSQTEHRLGKEVKSKEKAGGKMSAKKKSAVLLPQQQDVDPDDAYIKLECAYNPNCGVAIRVNKDRENKLAEEILSWGAKDPKRSGICNSLRDQIRQEHLIVAPASKVDSFNEEELHNEFSFGEECGNKTVTAESHEEVGEELISETAEVAKYLTLPPQLMDKFIPLSFVTYCMKEKLDDEHVVYVTPEMAIEERAKRQQELEARMNRIQEMDLYNDIHMLEWQKTRHRRIEQLFVDSTWKPELECALVARDLAIQEEINDRQVKLKMESKKEQQIKKDIANKSEGKKKK